MKGEYFENDNGVLLKDKQKEEKHKMYNEILVSLEQLNLKNTAVEDLKYIFTQIQAVTRSQTWRSFPNSLWISILKNLTSLKDLHTSLLVSKTWSDILLSEDFWENYVSSQWNLDITIKNEYTLPASKYAKLRLYIDNHQGFGKSTCSKEKRNKKGDVRRITSYNVLFSRKQVGLICICWSCKEDLNLKRESLGASYFCEVICNEYSKQWLRGSDGPACMVDNVASKKGKYWIENEQFKKIREMLGFENWKELFQQVVDVCLKEHIESVWTGEGDEYVWEDFWEFYSDHNDYKSKCDKGWVHVVEEVSKLEKITKLKLLCSNGNMN
eukprot:TRINITY_DN8504_c0_g1_i4.p1 TRINITY_DN8504_c0_g1~~TRINITY_DN8504_c0_g1_i4.p1  ORF type:complete len:326 (+),score=93.27 TRINITY_DN8504_c0_g1_i4:13-990(+)